MPKLSIIIPVFNVEAYVSRCINSVLSQTYTDFEVIIVNDGSQDKSGKIADIYAKKDNRIKVVHQENKGVSAARNAGLRESKGEYIGFVDPDDWIEPNMYSTLISLLEHENCDIVSCSWMNNDEKGKETQYYSDLPSTKMSREQFMMHFFDMPPTILGSVCLKVFRRNLLKSVFSEKYTICEDNLFLAENIVNIQNAFYTCTPLYHIFSRQDSTTRRDKSRLVLGLPVRKKIIRIARSVSEECGMLAENVFLDQCFAFSNKHNVTDLEYLQMAREEFCDYLKNNYLSVFLNRKIHIKLKIIYFVYFLKYIILMGKNQLHFCRS